MAGPVRENLVMKKSENGKYIFIIEACRGSSMEFIKLLLAVAVLSTIFLFNFAWAKIDQLLERKRTGSDDEACVDMTK